MRLVGALLVAVCSGLTLMANAPTPLDLTLAVGSRSFHPVIDNQSWWLTGTITDPDHTVSNPFSGCSWDINEISDYATWGDLAAGASSSRTDCHVVEFTPIYSCQAGYCSAKNWYTNWLGFQVRSKSAGVQVTMCFSPHGRCFTTTPIYEAASRVYVSKLCVQAKYTVDDPAVVDIPGSNWNGGLTIGRGVVTTITRSVMNQSSRNARDVQASWGLTSDVFTAPGCPNVPPYFSSTNPTLWPTQTEYPFRWVVP